MYVDDDAVKPRVLEMRMHRLWVQRGACYRVYSSTPQFHGEAKEEAYIYHNARSVRRYLGQSLALRTDLHLRNYQECVF